MSITDDFNAFAEQTRSLSEDVQTELATFPSGAVMLEVRCRGRLFVLACSPSWGFGVDEVENGAGLGTSFRHGFDDIALAKEKLLSLLASATTRTAAS